jgi:hypothetical protein
MINSPLNHKIFMIKITPWGEKLVIFIEFKNTLCEKSEIFLIKFKNEILRLTASG